jgi:hypothetical protein
VYIQYPEGQKENALAAQSKLQQSGYKTLGIERVQSVPTRLQVRYYRSDQKEIASSLAILVGQTLKVATSADNTILVKSDKVLPDGILELWLPRSNAE